MTRALESQYSDLLHISLPNKVCVSQVIAQASIPEACPQITYCTSPASYSRFLGIEFDPSQGGEEFYITFSFLRFSAIRNSLAVSDAPVRFSVCHRASSKSDVRTFVQD